MDNAMCAPSVETGQVSCTSLWPIQSHDSLKTLSFPPSISINNSSHQKPPFLAFHCQHFLQVKNFNSLLSFNFNFKRLFHLQNEVHYCLCYSAFGCSCGC